MEGDWVRIRPTRSTIDCEYAGRLGRAYAGYADDVLLVRLKEAYDQPAYYLYFSIDEVSFVEGETW